MSWKKNVFSYILWIIYTLAVTLGILEFCGQSLDMGRTFGANFFVVIGAIYLVAGLLVLGIHKLVNKILCGYKVIGYAPLLLEAVAVVALFTAGILVRVNLLPALTGTDGDMLYYEAAMVTAEHSVPVVLHGATYIYLQLLHTMFLFLGNRFSVAIVLQIILVCVAAVFLYFSFRELAGKIPAVIALTALMLSPYMLMQTTALSPELMYLLIYAIGLWLITDSLKKNDCNPMVYVGVGLIIGICIYLDIMGVTLLVFGAGVFAVERGDAVYAWNRRWVSYLLQLAGALIGWFLIIVLDASMCGKNVLSVMDAWLGLYNPCVSTGAISFFKGTLWENLILCVLLLLGIYGFWCRKAWERQGIWIGVILVYVLLHYLGMLQAEMSGDIYGYLLLVVLAGVGCCEIFAVNTDVTEKPVTEAEQDDKERYEETAVQKVQFLDNPLPLPKKHTAKVMDYPITDVSEDDFDYAVSEDDDYDI